MDSQSVAFHKNHLYKGIVDKERWMRLVQGGVMLFLVKVKWGVLNLAVTDCPNTPNLLNLAVADGQMHHGLVQSILNSEVLNFDYGEHHNKAKK